MSTLAGVLPSAGGAGVGGAGNSSGFVGGGSIGGVTPSASSFLSQNNAASITAPVVEPPGSFGIVAPGVYRCSASSLTQGLPISSNAGKGLRQTSNNNGNGYTNGNSSSSSINNNTNSNINSSSNNNNNSNPSSSSTLLNQGPSSTSPMTPTESFLSSLRLKTILLIVHEKKPEPIASWCASNNVKLIHLGLGALAERRADGDSEREAPSSQPLQDSIESFDNLSDTGILSMERIVKDSLEIVLQQNRLPCLMCDTSGVRDVGVVVGCLRRMQRRSFASIRYEYRAFAGSRSRSSHERFIEVSEAVSSEWQGSRCALDADHCLIARPWWPQPIQMFDPDLVSLPPKEALSPWFAQQQSDDEAEEARVIIR